MIVLLPQKVITIKHLLYADNLNQPHCEEDWVKTTFTSESTFNTNCGYADNNIIKIQTTRLVLADALRRAIPSLDIVLTPNGFGIVNSSNIAPATKTRVDRLVGSMLSHRDDCITALIPELVGAFFPTSSRLIESKPMQTQWRPSTTASRKCPVFHSVPTTERIKLSVPPFDGSQPGAVDVSFYVNVNQLIFSLQSLIPMKK